MNENLRRRSHTGGEEHRLPHRRLLTKIVLARNLYARPKPGEFFLIRPTKCRDIIHQRIEPNIHHVLCVIRHRYPPWHFLRQSRDTEILWPSLDKCTYFIQTLLRDDETGILPVQGEEHILKFRESKEIILFFDDLDLAIRMIRTLSIHQFRIGLFQFASDAILHLILLLVDIAIRETPPPEFLRRFDMMRVRRPYEIRIADIEKRFE